MFEHLLRVEVREEETNVVALHINRLDYIQQETREREQRTGTGFRRSTTKFSARIIMKRVNLWHRIRSMSSACLILIEKRRELMEASIRTFSFSLREMTTGWRMTSFVVLLGAEE